MEFFEHFKEIVIKTLFKYKGLRIMSYQVTMNWKGKTKKDNDLIKIEMQIQAKK